MKELEYCIAIINLFENENLSNTEVLNKVLERKYHVLAKQFDKSKKEQGKAPKNYRGNLSSFEPDFYEALLSKGIQTLQENIEKHEESNRYYYRFLSYIRRIKDIFLNNGMDETVMFSYIEKIDKNVGRYHLLLHLLEHIEENGEIEKMQFYIDKMPVDYEGNNTYYKGYRVLLSHYAKQGDLDNFKQLFKLCKPVKEKYKMARLKEILVYSYSKKMGYKKAMQLCLKAPFKNFEFSALIPCTEIKSYPQIKKIVRAYPAVEQSPKYLKEQLFVLTLEQEFKKGKYSEKYFLEVLEQLKTIDRKFRVGDCKLKDSLLLDLGQCTENYELVITCRKLIGYNLLKQELKPWELKVKNSFNKM